MTSLITRCPKCATAFNVTEAHLNTANGAVRCGSCLTVFNGRENLSSIAKASPISTLLDDEDDILISDDFIIDEDNVHDHSDKDSALSTRIKNLLQPSFNDDDDDDESWALKLLEDEGHDADFIVHDDAIDIKPKPIKGNSAAPVRSESDSTLKFDSSPKFESTPKSESTHKSESTLKFDGTIKIESTKGPSNDIQLDVRAHDKKALTTTTEIKKDQKAHTEKTTETKTKEQTKECDTEKSRTQNTTPEDSSRQKTDVEANALIKKPIKNAKSAIKKDATQDATKESSLADNPTDINASENTAALITPIESASTSIEPASAQQSPASEEKIHAEAIEAAKASEAIATGEIMATDETIENGGTNATSEAVEARETTLNDDIATGDATDPIEPATTSVDNHQQNARELPQDNGDSPTLNTIDTPTPASLKAEAYANSKAQEESNNTEIDEQAFAELSQELGLANAKATEPTDGPRVPNTGTNTNHSLLHSIEAETLELSYTAKGSRWKTRTLWVCLAALAACALFAQIAWMKFDQLSLQQPYRQYYGIACQYLDCSLPQLRDISKIRTTNLLVRQHPTTEGALLVDVVIQNLADFEQPFPKLVMVFSNIKEKVVASRAFEPSEYLGGDLLGATLMPRQKAIHLSLELVDPGNGAESYKIMISP